MNYIDCFNGDADGICALTQIRLRNPVESELVTGVKRDINLVSKVTASSGDIVTVLDVSFDKNRVDVERVISEGAEVFYCDHHYVGETVEHPRLECLINTSPNVCTSMLVNQKLKGRYLAWAVVGAFGDNLSRSAKELAKPLDLNSEQLSDLQKLGVYLNYNGYGAEIEDLYFHPADLFRCVSKHSNPQVFMQDDKQTFETLETGYQADMQNASSIAPTVDQQNVAVFQLPNAAWARRVSGVYGNELANQHPARAHAVLTEKPNGNLLVSVRAPLNNKRGADKICRQFPSGGGRAAAAGINDLPADQLNKFIDTISNFYS